MMAIGRTFQESVQKALRGLEVGVSGFDPLIDDKAENFNARLEAYLKNPGPDRIWYVADAFRAGFNLLKMSLD